MASRCDKTLKCHTGNQAVAEIVAALSPSLSQPLPFLIKTLTASYLRTLVASRLGRLMALDSSRSEEPLVPAR